MTMEEIRIRVTPDAAAAYLGASEQQRRKFDALLSLRLTEVVRTGTPLREVIRQASSESQADGLTPEILQEILDGE